MQANFIKVALAEDWAVPLGPDCDAFEYKLEVFVNHKVDVTEPLHRR